MEPCRASEESEDARQALSPDFTFLRKKSSLQPRATPDTGGVRNGFLGPFLLPEPRAPHLPHGDSDGALLTDHCQVGMKCGVCHVVVMSET